VASAQPSARGRCGRFSSSLIGSQSPAPVRDGSRLRHQVDDSVVPLVKMISARRARHWITPDALYRVRPSTPQCLRLSPCTRCATLACERVS